MTPVKLDYARPTHRRPPRPVYADRLGFFRGALAAALFAAWLVLMVLILTTS